LIPCLGLPDTCHHAYLIFILYYFYSWLQIFLFSCNIFYLFL
jgi:hypothetical protein